MHTGFHFTSSFHSLFKEIPMTKRAKLISLHFLFSYVQVLFSWLCHRGLVYMNGKRKQSHQLKSQNTMEQVRLRFACRKTKNHFTIYKENHFSDKSGMEITPFPIRYSFTTTIYVYTTHDTRTHTHTLTQSTQTLLPWNPFTEKFWMTSIWDLSFTVHASRFCFVKTMTAILFMQETRTMYEFKAEILRNVFEFSFCSTVPFWLFSILSAIAMLFEWLLCIWE